jgi:hypothetical protein
MQHADIVHARHRIGIAGHKVVCDIALPEALAVQRYLQFVEDKAVGFTRGEYAHVIRKGQAFRDLTFGVVIAVKDESLDASLGEPAHLEGKEETGMEVAPVTVIEVAGNDDKGDLLVNRLSDKIVKGLAGRGSDALSGRSFMPRKTY